MLCHHGNWRWMSGFKIKQLGSALCCYCCHTYAHTHTQTHTHTHTHTRTLCYNNISVHHTCTQYTEYANTKQSVLPALHCKPTSTYTHPHTHTHTHTQHHTTHHHTHTHTHPHTPTHAHTHTHTQGVSGDRVGEEERGDGGGGGVPELLVWELEVEARSCVCGYLCLENLT